MNAIRGSATVSIPVKRIDSTGLSTSDDVVAVEEPLAIRLSWPAVESGEQISRDIAVTMRMPGDDTELAAGFLFTEGLIDSADRIANIVQSADDADDNLVEVTLNVPPLVDPRQLERNFFISSSCGICGKASLDAIRTHAQFPVRGDDLVMPSEALAELPGMLAAGQQTFAGTGSVHAAALFTANGLCSEVYEDVGRHNAVDKLMGDRLLAAKMPLWNIGLFVSGRSSFELVQKARMAGCAMLAAVGAPSSLAIELAWESDMTLVGFVRDGRFNVYAGPARIG